MKREKIFWPVAWVVFIPTRWKSEEGAGRQMWDCSICMVERLGQLVGGGHDLAHHDEGPAGVRGLMQ